MRRNVRWSNFSGACDKNSRQTIDELALAAWLVSRSIKWINSCQDMKMMPSTNKKSEKPTHTTWTSYKICSKPPTETEVSWRLPRLLWRSTISPLMRNDESKPTNLLYLLVTPWRLVNESLPLPSHWCTHVIPLGFWAFGWYSCPLPFTMTFSEWIILGCLLFQLRLSCLSFCLALRNSQYHTAGRAVLHPPHAEILQRHPRWYTTNRGTRSKTTRKSES